MNKVSDIHDESEVLFMLGSIFCLNQICHDQSSAHARMSIIRMTLCSDHDNDLKQLYDHMKNEYHREETNLLSLGDVMLKMGKFDLAEKYYRRLLSELPSNDPSLSALYQRLGMVADAKGEYDTSLEWYQKSLEILVRTNSSDHVNIGLTHNSIGEARRKKGDHSRAPESYNRAVSLFKQAHDENHPDMAMFYNNIGIIYYEQQKYLEALDFYEKSLAIWKKHLPSDHPALGSSYNNIGAVHDCLGHYDLALEHYNRSLENRLKSLPAQHPHVAMTYTNMGLVYEDKRELEQRLTFL
jgi:tetratricopeptide (TPR) repeat protein